ncbi:MAG TPA: heat-inducible transcription repressor HrcA [Thermoanaerobacterales bacterium]|nr:heat-inducible transcription repressor HrcA [Thermoanaerobacterales bacterium]
MKLDERKRFILKAIIDDYIFSAEPIGSRTIARKYNMGISPATIRNEMADLEEMGYLEQPYTSSGRVPSDKGYRFYVDFLMKNEKLTEKEISEISGVFKKKITEIEDVIEQATKVLSDMTNYTSLVLGPQLNKSSLKHLQILPIDEGKALVIVVTNTGLVEHCFIKVPIEFTGSDLTRISNLINSKVQGLSINKITPSLLSKLKKEIINMDDVIDLVMNITIQSLNKLDGNKIYLGGATNLLSHPEFKDIDKAKKFLLFLEEKQILYNILTEASFSNEDLVVTIGSENKYELVQDCSLITTTYKVAGKTIGIIGVLGPTRMDYSKVISVVDYIKLIMNKIFSELFNDDK